MSDLLNQASLVMIPSGYKEDVVYSQIPTDGSGDLSLTRASNGTRINSAGLVEVAPWNLIEYSEQFDNSVWQKINTSSATTPVVTANYTTSPNGVQDADRVRFARTGTTDGIYSLLLSNTCNLTTNGTYTMYVKSLTSSTQNLLVYWGGGQGGVFQVTTEWTRITLSNLSSANQPILFGTRGGTGNYYSGGDLSIDIAVWGAQLNIGSTAKPYFHTTDRLNVPRLTYQNGGGGCPSLLLEKQSTNLIAYSNGNSADAFRGTLTNNATTSPEGVSNAFSFLVNSGQSGGIGFITITTSAQSYTFSAYLKGSVNGQKVELRGDLNGTIETFTLTTDWVRYTKTFTGSVGAQTIYLLNGGYLSPADYNLYYGYGLQLEASSYATSLIPTNGSSATRVADVCKKTSISSLIGQQEGVVFIDFVYNGSEAQPGNLFNMNQSTTASVFVVRTSSGLTDCGVFVSGVVKGQINNVGNIAIGSRIKLAYAYKSGDSALYINGSQIGTSSVTFTIPATLSEIILNDNTAYFAFQQSVSFNETVLFPTRLTNAELASLTTL